MVARPEEVEDAFPAIELEHQADVGKATVLEDSPRGPPRRTRRRRPGRRRGPTEASAALGERVSLCHPSAPIFGTPAALRRVEVTFPLGACSVGGTLEEPSPERNIADYFAADRLLPVVVRADDRPPIEARRLRVRRAGLSSRVPRPRPGRRRPGSPRRPSSPASRRSRTPRRLRRRRRPRPSFEAPCRRRSRRSAPRSAE